MPHLCHRSAATVRRIGIALICGALLTSSACADDSNTTVNAFDELQRPGSLSTLTVCHGFGCRLQTSVDLLSSDRAAMTRIMRGAGSSAAEREAIAAVVAWFDRRVGPIAGTQHHIAKARGGNVTNTDHQFDCIDTSHNTTVLLFALADMKLLRHHRVAQPVSRAQPHTTAVVTEIANGRQWAVDAWTHAAGQRPDVLPLEQWFARSD